MVCSFPYWYLWKAGFGMQFPLLIFMESRVWYAVSLIDIYEKQGLVCSFPYWYLWKAGFGMQFPLLIFMESRVWYAVSLIDIYWKQGLICSFPYWYLWKAGFGMQFPLLIFMKSRVWCAVSILIFMKSRVWYAVYLIDIYGKQGLVCSFPYWYLWKAGFDMQFPSSMNVETAYLHNNYLFSYTCLRVDEGSWIPWIGWRSKKFGDPHVYGFVSYYLFLPCLISLRICLLYSLQMD